MPGFDGKGPFSGRTVGRGLGPCGNGGNIQNTGRGFGAGQGRGFGAGQGRGFGFRQTNTQNTSQEINDLKKEIAELKKELNK